MKYIRLVLFALFLIPVGGALAATMPNNEFMVAAQLLSAAKNADIQQVQNLINAGADVNYVDSTGLSLVCTALMNNDVRAAQILQMYGADASQCDRQIKQYESRTQPTESGGLFSGLSSAQTISLAAAGAAVVVGGLFLLTDWLDPGNENDGGSSSGNRPGGDNGENGGGATIESSEIPVGPAYFTSDDEIAYSTAAYQQNLAQWDPTAGGIRAVDFNYFRPGVKTDSGDDEDAPQIQQTYYTTDGINLPLQNYLLIMHGYSSFANGYMGQYTFRDDKHNPQKILNTTSGGNPIRTALITANGVNPAGSADRGAGIVWASSTAVNANTGTVDKYANYNNPSDGAMGDEVATGGFDLSGSGTAMNPFASATESALAKIVAGWEADGRAYGDLYGFAPNSQLSIYRTCNGKGWVNIENPTEGESVGTLTDGGAAGVAGKLNPGDTITFGGKTYTISSARDDAGVTNPTITVGDTTYKLGTGSDMMRGVCVGEGTECEDVSDIVIYQGTDGYYYFNTSGGDTIDGVYVIDNNNIYAQKELKDIDVKTFEALFNMPKVYEIGGVNGLSSIAVTTLNPQSRKISYTNTDGVESYIALVGGNERTAMINLVDAYYDVDSSDPQSQGQYANAVLGNYVAGMPILIMPAGEFEYGIGDGKSLSVLDATFENYAPAIYNNLEHHFMTIVAVQHSVGTSAADSIADYGNGTGDDFGRLYLSAWTDTKGTTETDDDVMYMSRKCGVAGLGINGVDPWCFSAAGPTAEMAVASAAGAVAALKGAFPYMANGDIFTLMALTADGPYLGTDSAGNAFTTDGLVSYLKSMYALPPDVAEDQLTGQAYLDAFADIYGYGMINLERAMTPGNKIYYYDGDTIKSDNGNAYWRAASNTVFRASSAFGGARAATISAPFFDVLESVDGKLTLPRVWKNEFALAADARRGLYMGDVLGEFKTRRVEPNRIQFGNFGFSMTASEKPYADNLDGLDNMRLDYTSGNWNFAAGYQRHFTDGASRFDGMSNPILGLASNAITTDALYNMKNWAFGARVFSGAITDETMMDNDPTLAAQYLPARLGLMQGAQADIIWDGDNFGFTASVGTAYETNTVLGAVSGGLLDMGNGNTVYVDSEFRYSPSDKISFKLRSTFARTVADASGEFILGLSEIDSNAFAFGMDAGNFSFSVSQPLAITRGYLQYPYANYDVVDLGDGKYDLNITDMHIENVDLSPIHREVRFTGEYRHNFGDFTDGAIGFIYRVNPNNTDVFGNESVFMMKLTHRLGI